MNNDTPRTDAALKEVLQCGYDYKVKAEFARQLERELGEAYRQISILWPIIKDGAQWHDEPKGDLDSLKYDDYTHFDNPSLAIQCRKAIRDFQRKSL